MKRLMIALATIAPGAASAQQADPSLAQETAALNAQAARDNATAAAMNAQSARVKAETDALGIQKVDGKTTISGTNTGVLEAWMLSSYVLDTAGESIAGDIRAALQEQPPVAASASGIAGPDPAANMGPAVPSNPSAVPAAASAKPRILLVAGDEVLALDTAANVRAQLALLDGRLSRAAAPVCQAPGPVGRPQAVGAVLPLIGAAANLLKTDTEISGLDITVPNRMLVAAVGKHLRNSATVVIPAAAVATTQSSPTASAWSDLLAKREVARACLPSTGDDKLPQPLQDQVKALKAALTAVDDAEAKLLKADDKGNTPLGQAVRVDALMITHPYVLRVNVEKAGGSLLKRSNVWTSLGAPAIALTGGLIASYSLTDPLTGELIRSADLVCRTAMTNMRDVQNERVRYPARHLLCRAPF